jgi:hypothetical protein
MAVGIGVGGDDLLVDHIGDFDGEVFLGVERGGQPFVLPGREQLDAGSGDAADAVERISGMAAPPQGLLLDALADQVELDPGQRDDVEGIHHRDRIRDHLGCCGFVAGEPVHRDDLHRLSEVCGLSTQPAGQRGR